MGIKNIIVDKITIAKFGIYNIGDQNNMYGKITVGKIGFKIFKTFYLDLLRSVYI